MKNFSKIIAGCMSWGVWGKNLTTEEMIAQINCSLEAGITTFDHADIYGDYSTESQFGKAFHQSNLEREEIQIISKCGIQYMGNARPNNVKHYNYTKEYIIWSVENSLKNLQTDYLDLLLLHRPSPLMNPIEIKEAVEKLKREGKILSFGVSNFTQSQMDLLASETTITANQIEFSLSQHLAMHDGTLDFMIKNKIMAMAWSPLGNYFREDNNATKRVKEVLTLLTQKYNASEDQILLAWLMKHPINTYPVIGTTQKERVKNSVKAIDINLELEDWFAMLVAQQGHKVP